MKKKILNITCFIIIILSLTFTIVVSSGKDGEMAEYKKSPAFQIIRTKRADYSNIKRVNIWVVYEDEISEERLTDVFRYSGQTEGCNEVNYFVYSDKSIIDKYDPADIAIIEVNKNGISVLMQK